MRLEDGEFAIRSGLSNLQSESVNVHTPHDTRYSYRCMVRSDHSGQSMLIGQSSNISQSFLTHSPYPFTVTTTYCDNRAAKETLRSHARLQRAGNCERSRCARARRPVG